MMNLLAPYLRQSILSLLLLFVSSSYPESFKYRETTGDTVRYLKADLEETPQGVHVSSNDGIIVMEHLLKPSRESDRYVLQTTDGRINVVARREGNAIRCIGTSDGKRVDRTIKIGRDPWCQEWSSKLSSFVKSGAASTRFCAVNPPKWDAYSFEAFNRGAQTVTIDGKPVETVHVRIALAGWLSFAWHGDYWFRRSDAKFIRYEGTTMPGSCKTVYEMVEEE